MNSVELEEEDLSLTAQRFVFSFQTPARAYSMNVLKCLLPFKVLYNFKWSFKVKRINSNQKYHKHMQIFFRVYRNSLCQLYVRLNWRYSLVFVVISEFDLVPLNPCVYQKAQAMNLLLSLLKF